MFLIFSGNKNSSCFFYPRTFCAGEPQKPVSRPAPVGLFSRIITPNPCGEKVLISEVEKKRMMREKKFIVFATYRAPTRKAGSSPLMTSKEKKLAKKEEKEKKYSQLVHAAIRRGSLSEIKKLLKKVAPSVPNSAEQTPLHTASIEGHEDIVQYLLQRKRVPVNAQDRDGWTPLHCACHSNHLMVVDVLISQGAEVTIETGQ